MTRILTATILCCLSTLSADAFAGCAFSQSRFDASGQDARFESSIRATCPRLGQSNCSLNPACEARYSCTPSASGRRKGVINCTQSGPGDPDCDCRF